MEKIVDFSKLSIKKIRELIVFTALIVVALWKFDVVLGVIKAVWGIIFPFALGGAIAFVINVPMSFLEKKLFGKAKEKGSKAAGKLGKTDQSSSYDRTGSGGDCACYVRSDSAAYGNNWKSDEQYCRIYSADAELGTGIYAQ